MKKIISLLLVIVMALSLVACGASAPAATEAPAEDNNVPMQYIKADEAKELLNSDEYVFFDIRKAADSSANSIPGAQAWDMDAAKEGDAEAGKATMTKATEGLDKKIILVCYSGKRYAQAATNALSAIGYDMSKVYTLEGGFTNWSEALPELTTNTPAETEAAPDVEALPTNKVFVSPEWVKSVIDGNQPESANYIIAETYWGPESDSPDYLTGHIPGAIHIPTETVECEPYWNLFDPETLEANMLAYGITKDTTVILYGNDVSGTCRVAYAYLYAGVENVKVINGSVEAWIAAGYDVETGSVAPVAADSFGATVPAHPEYWISIEDAAQKLENDPNFKLVSIRSKIEWLGETSGYSYMDKAGEPKGAVYGYAGSDPYHMEDYLNEDGTYITYEQMLELWADCDFTVENELAFYCGTGWRATIPFLLCYEGGVQNMKLYDGGWYQWLMHDDLPVQVGDPSSPDVVYTTVGELETGKAAK